MRQKTFDKWVDRCIDDLKPWTEKDIIYFRKAARIAPSLYGFLKGPYSITPEQTTKGIAYLRSHCWKKNGHIRKNCVFGELERDIIKDFRCFEFIGCVITNGSYSVPCYRVYAGIDFFDYTTSMGEMIVISSGKENVTCIA